MEYFDRIQNVIEHIEKHLKEELTLVDLAKISCFSPFHFHRIFQILTGINIMDYLRQRRLTVALEELEKDDRTILEIALSFQFNSCDTFTRAFKRQYGINPGTYRKTREIKSNTMEKINLIEKLNLTNYRSFFMEPKFITKKSFNFAGMELKTTSVDGKSASEIPEFWQKYIKNNWREKIINKVDDKVEIAICSEFNPVTQTFSYVIGFEVKCFDGLSKDVYCKKLPELKYAVFTTPKASRENFSNSIQNAANFIFKEWLPKSGYEYEEKGVDFELYDQSLMNDTECRMNIYVPVK